MPKRVVYLIYDTPREGSLRVYVRSNAYADMGYRYGLRRELYYAQREKRGNIRAVLYEPEKIIEVRSANLEILYKEGRDSLWGMEVLYESVLAHNPDLVILGFGMNGAHRREHKCAFI